MSGCEIHGAHRPEPVVIHSHHVLPKAMGGPDVAANRVEVCPTGHANIHAALHAIVLGKPIPKVARVELQLARRGHQAWLDAGRPGNPHAAF